MAVYGWFHARIFATDVAGVLLLAITKNNKRHGEGTGMTVLQQGAPGGLDPAGEAGSDAVLQAAVRKAAVRFVPLLTIAYLFNLSLIHI